MTRSSPAATVPSVAEAALLSEYAQLCASPRALRGETRAVRDAAIARLAQQGLPHRRMEAWKYSDVRQYVRAALPVAKSAGAELTAQALALPAVLPQIEVGHISLVNGFCGQWSGIPDGVDVMPMADAKRFGHAVLRHAARLPAQESNGVLDWNTAFSTSGVLVGVRSGRQIALPLHLDVCLVGDASSATPRHFVHVGAGASLTLIETVRGAGVHHLNSVCDILLESGARLTHILINTQERAALHLAQRNLHLDEGADYTGFALHEGVGFSRDTVFVRFAGENARLTLAGVHLGAGQQHGDTTLVISHDKPRCSSRELFRYVLNDTARGVFQGKISVQPDAQKTDGQMKADALMLSDGPEFDAKPELEIFADDVICAHGATCGQMDDELLFYLRARGLGEQQAKTLMVQAFLGQTMDVIPNEDLRTLIEERVQNWLVAHG